MDLLTVYVCTQLVLLNARFIADEIKSLGAISLNRDTEFGLVDKLPFNCLCTFWENLYLARHLQIMGRDRKIKS